MQLTVEFGWGFSDQPTSRILCVHSSSCLHICNLIYLVGCDRIHAWSSSWRWFVSVKLLLAEILREIVGIELEILIGNLIPATRFKQGSDVSSPLSFLNIDSLFVSANPWTTTYSLQIYGLDFLIIMSACWWCFVPHLVVIHSGNLLKFLTPSQFSDLLLRCPSCYDV